MSIAKDFWDRVDKCNPYPTLMELAEHTGCTYTKFRQQRVKQILPKAEDVLSISRELLVTTDFLLTGMKYATIYKPRIEEIAKRCQFYATETDLAMIERILRIPGEFEVVEKKDDRASSSTTA